MHISSDALFSHLFYGIGDIVYLVLNILLARIVRKTKWQFHLRWIIPYIYQCAFQLIARTIQNTHYLLGFWLPGELYVIERMFYYIGNVIGIYGTVILLKVLREMVNGTLPEVPQVSPTRIIDDTVWPPPPVSK